MSVLFTGSPLPSGRGARCIQRMCLTLLRVGSRSVRTCVKQALGHRIKRCTGRWDAERAGQDGGAGQWRDALGPDAGADARTVDEKGYVRVIGMRTAVRGTGQQ